MPLLTKLFNTALRRTDEKSVWFRLQSDLSFVPALRIARASEWKVVNLKNVCMVDEVISQVFNLQLC